MLDWATFVACSRPAAHKCFVEWVFQTSACLSCSNNLGYFKAVASPLPRCAFTNICSLLVAFEITVSLVPQRHVSVTAQTLGGV